MQSTCLNRLKKMVLAQLCARSISEYLTRVQDGTHSPVGCAEEDADASVIVNNISRISWSSQMSRCTGRNRLLTTCYKWVTGAG